MSWFKYLYIYNFSYLNRIISNITIFLFGRKISWLKYIYIYNFSYINHVIFTIIVFPFGRKISCNYSHVPQSLSPHTWSLTPTEYSTGTTLAPAALAFSHEITHVSTDEHRPDASQITWGGLSYYLMKQCSTVSSHDMPPVILFAATTNSQCSVPWMTLFWGFCDHPDVTLRPTRLTVSWIKYG